MVKTEKSRLRFQIQIKEFVDRIKIIDPKTQKPRMSYKIKSLVVPVYDTDLSLAQIKKIVERALNSSEKKSNK